MVSTSAVSFIDDDDLYSSTIKRGGDELSCKQGWAWYDNTARVEIGGVCNWK